MQIALEQKKRLGFLRETLQSLQKSLGRENRGDFEAMNDRLDEWAAKISVIGQVKAGKSTFLNAFLQRHDFLPNDVNPWTSVVTNILVNAPGDRQTGARFDFFSTDDWDEIINGSSHLRKLAEQLLPGFDSELLKQQGEEMRDWARVNLGDSYYELLGTNHDYEFVTPDLLKRYVCAGNDDKANSKAGTVGRYSALTREANVWMKLPEFQVPAIVTDTPGVNDPFLVRDEVTCRSLDRSDVFVVVLSAHQALTDVDIGLIRILVQQDSKDVLIFVNRIDELDDYDTRYTKVIDDVSKRLREAIPGIEFEIVCGSAFMADVVFINDEEGAGYREMLDNDVLERYLKNRYGEVPETREDRLLLGSGLDSIKEALSRIIDTGEGSRQLAQLQEDVRARVMSLQFGTRRDHRSVRDVIDRLMEEEPAEISAMFHEEIALIGAVTRDVDTCLDRARGEIEGSLDHAWSDLESQLNSLVEEFIGKQESILDEHVSGANMRENGSSEFEIDVTPLHARLEETVRFAYDGARGNLDEVMEGAMRECCTIVAERLSEDFEALSLEELPFDSFTSTLATSKKSIKLEMVTQRSWAFWRRARVDLNRTVEAMKALALAEMKPALEKLVGAFNEAQSERAAAGLDRVGLLQHMMESNFIERSKALKKDEAVFAEMAGNDVMRNQVIGRLQSQLEVLERRLQILSASESSLTSRSDAKAAA